MCIYYRILLLEVLIFYYVHTFQTCDNLAEGSFIELLEILDYMFNV